MKTELSITKELLDNQKLFSKSSEKTELSHFKKLMEKSNVQLGNFSLYTSFVKKTWLYRGLFTVISFLFFYLAIAIHPKSFTWTASLFFAFPTKTLLVSGCVALGSIAMLLACSFCAVKELTGSKISKAYRELWKLHEERKLKKKIDWLSDCKEKLHLKSVLHHLYRDVCDKIDVERRETAALIFAIRKRDKMTSEYKERLIEQALDELDAKLAQHLNTFSSSWIS